MHARTGICPPPNGSPTVVLLHGMLISSRYMVPTAERLASLCRVYAVDLPGHGRSFRPPRVLCVPELADVLAAWMDAAAISKAHFAGNSFGCQVLTEFALRHPERVGRLVLIGPTVDPEARSFARQLWRLIRDYLESEPWSLGWIAAADYIAAGPRRAKATVELVLRDRIEERLPRVQVPTLVVIGEKDRLVPVCWAERVAALLPRGELKILPGVGHAANYAAPAALIQVMRPFLGI